jgi:hypothetical protein
MEKKLIKVMGKWEWYLSEDKKVYKSFSGSGSYTLWDCPSWIDLDAEWERLFKVNPEPKKEVILKVEQKSEKSISKPIKEGVSVRMEQIRRKRLGINKGVGRPSKVSFEDFYEFYSANSGSSIAFLARKFNISGVSARKYVKKCETDNNKKP